MFICAINHPRIKVTFSFKCTEIGCCFVMKATLSRFGDDNNVGGDRAWGRETLVRNN